MPRIKFDNSLPKFPREAVDRHDGYAEALEGEKLDWSVTVRMPGSMRHPLQYILNHEGLGFRGNPAIFARWALTEGADAIGKMLEKDGDPTVRTYLRLGMLQRKRVVELQRRLEFLNDLNAFESSFHIYMQAGDVEALNNDLQAMYDFVESIEEPFWKGHLSKAALSQPLIQQALEYLASTHHNQELVEKISAWGEV